MSRYSLHPGYEMAANLVAGLPSKTGKTLDEWLALIRAEGPASRKDRLTWLRARGMGNTTANVIVDYADGQGLGAPYEPERYVAEMFRGKESLLPIYDRLLDLALGLGDDVRACPTGTTVPLYRRFVFAQLRPASRTRVDLGLALKDAPVEGRLLDTGGLAKGDRITRRIAVESLDQVDAELERYLRAAYELDA